METEQDVDSQQGTILIVDDRPENLLAIETALQRLGADIVRAQSGKEALSLTLRHDFAVVLLDVQMPEMDGFETASLMRGRKNTQHVPIIFVTAISKDEEYVFKGYETGAVDYLFKPIDPDMLRGKVQVFLDLYRQKRELERAREELQQRNQDLEDFTRFAAHDMKSPLIRIAGFCNVLKKECAKNELSEKATEFVDIMVKNARQMTQLIDDLLKYARMGRSKPTLRPTDLKSVAKAVIENLEAIIQKSRGRVEVGSMPTVLGDAGDLAELMQNLIVNAVKFRGDEPPAVKVTARSDGDKWRISVQDNGIGIAPEDHDELFVAFRRLNSQSEYEGSGIGLATCRKIVEQHQGRIWVESELGNGATFHFTLAAAKPDELAPGENSKSEPAHALVG